MRKIHHSFAAQVTDCGSRSDGLRLGTNQVVINSCPAKKNNWRARQKKVAQNLHLTTWPDAPGIIIHSLTICSTTTLMIILYNLRCFWPTDSVTLYCGYLSQFTTFENLDTSAEIIMHSPALHSKDKLDNTLEWDKKHWISSVQCAGEIYLSADGKMASMHTCSINLELLRNFYLWILSPLDSSKWLLYVKCDSN